jgi:hypothetical protein
MSKANWQLLLAAAEELTATGGSPFGRQDLIREVHRLNPDRTENSLNPTIQGMTINAPGGVPVACGPVFRRVSRGLYELLSASARLDPPQKPQSGPRGPRSSTNKSKERIEELISGFDEYVFLYERQFPFTKAGQFQLHRQTIERRRQHGTVQNALTDQLFIDLLYRTLQKWGIGVRGSRLVPLPRFQQVLVSHLDVLDALQNHSIENPPSRVAQRVYDLIANLGVVDNKAKLVAGSKTLHHLLPDLVPPVDRRYTGAFFGWSTLAPQDSQERIFLEAFGAFEKIAAAVQPSRLVGAGWRTSSSKIIDNAIVGYCLSNDL